MTRQTSKEFNRQGTSEPSDFSVSQKKITDQKQTTSQIASTTHQIKTDKGYTREVTIETSENQKEKITEVKLTDAERQAILQRNANQNIPHRTSVTSQLAQNKTLQTQEETKNQVSSSNKVVATASSTKNVTTETTTQVTTNTTPRGSIQESRNKINENQRNSYNEHNQSKSDLQNTSIDVQMIGHIGKQSTTSGRMSRDVSLIEIKAKDSNFAKNKNGGHADDNVDMEKVISPNAVIQFPRKSSVREIVS